MMHRNDALLDTAYRHRAKGASRCVNALEGITGLLWSDGCRFMQAIEGPRAGIELVFDRIKADPRHHSLIVLSDRRIVAHEFGSWTMAHRRVGDAPDAYDALVTRLLAKASEPVRAHFFSLISTGHVADKVPPPVASPSNDRQTA